MMSKCKFLGIFPKHDWNNWEDLGMGRMLYGGGDVGVYVRMKKVCKNCGLVKLKDVRT